MRIITCPACGARYKVSASTAGKRARCKRCDRPFKIPEVVKDSGRLTLTQLPPVPGEEVAEPPPDALAAGAVEAIPVDAAALGYAAQPPPEADELAARGYRAYFRSLAKSLAFLARAGSLVTFLILLALLTLGAVAGVAISPMFCFIALVPLIIACWYISFQFSVVLGAAAGEEDLPTLRLTEGWWEDLVLPAIKMTATFLVARLPALVFLLILSSSQGLTMGQSWLLGVRFVLAGDYNLITTLPDVIQQVTVGLLLLGGFFLWPMFVLIVAVGSLDGLLRIDLMGITIARSWPAYLLTVLVVYAAQSADVLISALLVGSQGGDTLIELLPPTLLRTIGSLYLTIIAMRAIGLYYHHFKHRFAWSWG